MKKVAGAVKRPPPFTLRRRGLTQPLRSRAHAGCGRRRMLGEGRSVNGSICRVHAVVRSGLTISGRHHLWLLRQARAPSSAVCPPGAIRPALLIPRPIGRVRRHPPRARRPALPGALALAALARLLAPPAGGFLPARRLGARLVGAFTSVPSLCHPCVLLRNIKSARRRHHSPELTLSGRHENERCAGKDISGGAGCQRSLGRRAHAAVRPRLGRMLRS
jgi:hypothetical protein